MSLSIVFGTPTTGSPPPGGRAPSAGCRRRRSRSWRRCRSPRPCDGRSRSRLRAHKGRGERFRESCPPRCRMPRTSSRVSGRTWPSIRPSQPLRTPTDLDPVGDDRAADDGAGDGVEPRAVAAGGEDAYDHGQLNTGTSASRPRDAPSAGTGDVVELVDIDAPHALSRPGDRNRGVRAAAERHHAAGRALEREIGCHHRVVSLPPSGRGSPGLPERIRYPSCW